MNILKILLLLLLPLTAMAENWNKWTLYPSYYGIDQVAPAGNDIYVVAQGALYSYNVKDGSLQTYTRLEGLSGNIISKIEWMQAPRQLVVAYDNCNIDLVSPTGNVYTISDLADKQMTVDKTIRCLYGNGNFVYVGTGFGLLKVDVRAGYVAESYNLSLVVSDIVVKDNDIYVLTGDNAVLKGAHGLNLYDPKEWQKVYVSWNTLKPNDNAGGKYGTLYNDITNHCYWGADENGRLTRYEKDGDEFVAKSTGVAPDGPKGNDVWRVYVHDGKVFVTAGSFSYGMTTETMMRPGLVNVLDGDGTWNILEEPSASLAGSDYKAANCMVFDPKDKNHYYVGSLSGLLEYRAGKCVNVFVPSNSKLCPIYDTSTTQSVVTSMNYDAAGNLWILNGWCSIPIVCYDSNGQWHNFQHSVLNFADRTALDLQGFISRNNESMWFVNNRWDTPRLYRYDIQSNHLTTFKTFRNEDESIIGVTQLFNVTEDNKGNVWVCSDAGPFYIAANEVKSDSPTFVQYKVPRNDGTNYADYLLDGIPVRCIAVDAANRKWIGTGSNGVYLISSDCNTQLYHFDIENSPLPSNALYDITIDNTTGRVYFATDKGLCSYKADVTENNGGEMTENSVTAYPNPVTPDYTGLISISGLSEHSQLRIMTASGQLVHQGMCYGGTYEWDGCDMQGRRVASGVYMVAVTDEGGEKGVLTKVAIVR